MMIYVGIAYMIARRKAKKLSGATSSPTTKPAPVVKSPPVKQAPAEIPEVQPVPQ